MKIYLELDKHIGTHPSWPLRSTLNIAPLNEINPRADTIFVTPGRPSSNPMDIKWA